MADYNIRCFNSIHLVLRLRGGGFAPQTLKVLYNNEFEKDVVINDYDEMDKTFENFVLGLFKNWNINENIHNFDFYIGEDLINKKFKETLHQLVDFNKTIKIFAKSNKDFSKEDDIILQQEINGLWKFDVSKLSWFDFTKRK